MYLTKSSIPALLFVMVMNSPFNAIPGLLFLHLPIFVLLMEIQAHSSCTDFHNTIALILVEDLQQYINDVMPQ